MQIDVIQQNEPREWVLTHIISTGEWIAERLPAAKLSDPEWDRVTKFTEKEAKALSSAQYAPRVSALMGA